MEELAQYRKNAGKDHWQLLANDDIYMRMYFKYKNDFFEKLDKKEKTWFRQYLNHANALAGK